jgi:hypothetical protein
MCFREQCDRGKRDPYSRHDPAYQIGAYAMATITINIPDAIAARVVNGFAQRYNYSPVLENGSANPETKSQFAKRKVIEFIKQAVREAEVQTATNTAATAAAAGVENDITLT